MVFASGQNITISQRNITIWRKLDDFWRARVYVYVYVCALCLVRDGLDRIDAGMYLESEENLALVGSLFDQKPATRPVRSAIHEQHGLEQHTYLTKKNTKKKKKLGLLLYTYIIYA